MSTKKEKKCFLCDRPASYFKGMMIEGLSGLICEECVNQCTKIYADQHRRLGKADGAPKVKRLQGKPVIPSPREVKDFLDKYVIGQDRSKRVLAVAVSNHYSRINAGLTDIMPDVELDKSNILFIGPTGTGKTLLAQTVAKMLDVPCAISDATTLTEAGYVGADPENMLLKLYLASGNDVEKTQRGIVVLDEIDKKSKKDAGVSITRDVSGEGVQSAILKLIEGADVDVPLTGGRKHPGAECVKINTKNILFILCGAFNGLDKIIETRVKGKGIMGFDQPARVNGQNCGVEPEDLIQFGLIPELVGRVPIVSMLDALTESDLRLILSEPKNSLVKQCEKMAKLRGAELSFDKTALDEIARLAFVRGTGARGLRAITENMLLNIMFSLKAGDKIVVGRDLILGQAA